MEDRYARFMEHVKGCAAKFKAGDASETIRLVSHMDADGISACSIVVKTLGLGNRKYSISTVQSLTREIVEELARDTCSRIIFTDIGSGQIRAINELLKEKEVIVLDHHLTEAIELNPSILHVNPVLFGFDGGREISGAGVAYLFCREVDGKIKSMAHIAIVGAIGDVQDENGLYSLNEEVLKDAVEEGSVRVIRGLRLFGAQTRPLHKVLEYSTDPYIPGVTGNESGSIQFLHHLGINPKNGNVWKKIVHLLPEELKNLVGGIIMKRSGEKRPEDVLGNVYLLPKEESESPFRDAKEFATLLNATGRMGKASLGIGVCLGDKRNRSLATRNLVAYKKEIINALNWFEDNKHTESVFFGNGFLIIRAEKHIKHAIIGTLASILSRSNKLKGVSYIVSIAHRDDGFSKVSVRKVGRSDEDLRGIIGDILNGLEGCEAGGHRQAAGAVIPTALEDEFVRRTKEILEKRNLEETIN